MMRDGKKAKKLDYLLIFGYSMADAGCQKSIVLYRGNGCGEERVRVLKTLDFSTKYSVALEEAKKLAAELNVKVGRDFSQDEWFGPLCPS